MAHRATATGTMNNLWRPKLSLTPPGIVRSIQDRLLTPRSIELSPPSLREIKVMKAGRGSRLTRLKNDVRGRRKKKESFDVVKKMMKKRKGWEKKEEEEKGIYIYILRLPGYIDVTFLRRPRSPFFFLFYTTPYFPGTA